MQANDDPDSTHTAVTLAPAQNTGETLDQNLIESQRAHVSDLIRLSRFQEARTVLNTFEKVLIYHSQSINSPQSTILEVALRQISSHRRALLRCLCKQGDFAEAVEVCIENLSACRGFLEDDYALSAMARGYHNDCVSELKKKNRDKGRVSDKEVMTTAQNSEKRSSAIKGKFVEAKQNDQRVEVIDAQIMVEGAVKEEQVGITAEDAAIDNLLIEDKMFKDWIRCTLESMDDIYGKSSLTTFGGYGSVLANPTAHHTAITTDLVGEGIDVPLLELDLTTPCVYPRRLLSTHSGETSLAHSSVTDCVLDPPDILSKSVSQLQETQQIPSHGGDLELVSSGLSYGKSGCAILRPALHTHIFEFEGCEETYLADRSDLPTIPEPWAPPEISPDEPQTQSLVGISSSSSLIRMRLLLRKFRGWIRSHRTSTFPSGDVPEKDHRLLLTAELEHAKSAKVAGSSSLATTSVNCMDQGHPEASPVRDLQQLGRPSTTAKHPSCPPESTYYEQQQDIPIYHPYGQPYNYLENPWCVSANTSGILSSRTSLSTLTTRAYGQANISGNGFTVQGDISKLEVHNHFSSDARLVSTRLQESDAG